MPHSLLQPPASSHRSARVSQLSVHGQLSATPANECMAPFKGGEVLAVGTQLAALIVLRRCSGARGAHPQQRGTWHSAVSVSTAEASGRTLPGLLDSTCAIMRECQCREDSSALQKTLPYPTERPAVSLAHMSVMYECADHHHHAANPEAKPDQRVALRLLMRLLR